MTREVACGRSLPQEPTTLRLGVEGSSVDLDSNRTIQRRLPGAPHCCEATSGQWLPIADPPNVGRDNAHALKIPARSLPQSLCAGISPTPQDTRMSPGSAANPMPVKRGDAVSGPPGDANAAEPSRDHGQRHHMYRVAGWPRGIRW